MMINEYFVMSKYVYYTQNELNNVVYMCLKYTFGNSIDKFCHPDNDDIKKVMLEVHNNQTAENIIDTILLFVIEGEGVVPNELDGEIEWYKNHMRYIINTFNKQSYEMRNDLGEDAEADEFITKH